MYIYDGKVSHMNRRMCWGDYTQSINRSFIYKVKEGRHARILDNKYFSGSVDITTHATPLFGYTIFVKFGGRGFQSHMLIVTYLADLYYFWDWYTILFNECRYFHTQMMFSSLVLVTKYTLCISFQINLEVTILHMFTS